MGAEHGFVVGMLKPRPSADRLGREGVGWRPPFFAMASLGSAAGFLA